MENTNVFLENGISTSVNGIFYVYNSKYYFMYTLGEVVEDDYVQLYIVQVCKEIQNTPNGQVDTGYMLGLEIKDQNEWGKVQESITKIVEDKKNNTQNSEIQYLPINMLINLKIVSKNKFKLLRNLLENEFKVVLPSAKVEINNLQNTNEDKQNDEVGLESPHQSSTSVSSESIEQHLDNQIDNDVIIDYRAKFFEEQDKNDTLEEQIKVLQDKIDSVKRLLG